MWVENKSKNRRNHCGTAVISGGAEGSRTPCIYIIYSKLHIKFDTKSTYFWLFDTMHIIH